MITWLHLARDSEIFSYNVHVARCWCISGISNNSNNKNDINKTVRKKVATIECRCTEWKLTIAWNWKQSIIEVFRNILFRSSTRETVNCGGRLGVFFNWTEKQSEHSNSGRTMHMQWKCAENCSSIEWVCCNLGGNCLD